MGAAIMADEQHIEEWRPVEGWPYEVSSLGRVRRTGASKGTTVGRILRVQTDKKGYLYVSLHRNTVKRNKFIARLVCRAFHGAAPTPLHEVAHWDGNEINNTPANLRWATHQENRGDDADRLGERLRGERTPWSKLSQQSVDEIRDLAAKGVLHREIAARYGISRTHVSTIKCRRSWRL
jgi:hypothetical protein